MPVIKSIKEGAEIAGAGMALPEIAETISPGLGLPVASVLGPVAGIGVAKAGIGLMLECI